jgi:alkaline phosphatase
LLFPVTDLIPPNFSKYPSYIFFDGRLEETYSENALSKIALLSEDFGDFVKKKYPLEITSSENNRINSLIAKAHLQNKKVRFWGVPRLSNCLGKNDRF